jgi:hypothetical protein
MAAPNYGPQTISGPFQAAINQYAVRARNQGAFHPSSLGVTDPVTSRVTAGPSNAPAVAGADQNQSDPMAALHAAIARYYGG